MSQYMKCRRCGETKDQGLFPRNKNVAGGIDKMCKVCWSSRKRSTAKVKPVVPAMPTLPETVNTASVREIFNVTEMERGANYECYYRGDGLTPIVNLFYRRYHRLPDELLIYKLYCYIKITDTEEKMRKTKQVPDTA